MIAIWGANGFIGRHLTQVLVAAGENIELFARDFDGFPFALSSHATCVPADFLSPQDTMERIRKCRTLVLMVNASQVRHSGPGPGQDISSSLKPYKVFFDELAEGPVPGHIIYLSSGGAVYGPVEVVRPIPETHPVRPVSPYGQVKLAVEELIQARAADIGFKYSILRVANPVGVWCKKAALVPVAIKAAKTGTPVTVFGDGSMIRDYFDVRELAHAIKLVAEKPGANEIYNVGSGKGRSINEVIEIVSRVTGREITVRHEAPNGLDVPYNVLDCGKIEKTVSWRAQEDLENIVKTMWDAE
jgi:UDP-glucose 4-epimerase